MSTSRGLFRWTPSSRLLRRYGVQQGIGSQEFLDRAITLTEEGMLAAATADGGIVLVDTTTAESAPAVPVLRLDSFAVRRDGRWQDVPLQPQMTLSPDEHEFIVRARLLAYDEDRKSTRLNSSSLMRISYAVFCLKKKNKKPT